MPTMAIRSQLDSSTGSNRRLSGRGGSVAGAFGTALAALYLAQHLTFPPGYGDGGLLLDYVHRMSEGAWPFWDFVDLYGPLCWVGPVLAYWLGGQQVWAVGVAVLLTKLLSVVLSYRLVARLAGRLPAWLAAFALTVLLGAPWQMLQIPYAMHPSLTLALAVWLLLLAPPPRRDAAACRRGPSLARVAVAGALTGAAFWVKFNAGAFLLAGGLFYCFYWLPAPSGPGERRGPSWLRAAQYAGIGVYAAVFGLFLRPSWQPLFLYYLVAPLLLALALTLAELRARPPDRAAALHRLRAWGVFLASALFVGVAFFLSYFGPRAGVVYVGEIAAILSRFDYAAPFPPIGEPGHFVGFSEHYWPQLPWLVSLAFLAAARLRAKHPLPNPPPRGGREWRVGLSHSRRSGTARGVPRHALIGLFALFTLQTFVIYSRADEAHLAQAVWPAVPAVFVMLGSIRRELGRPRWASLGLTAGAVAMALPLIVIRPESYRWGPGDWHSPHLRHLTFHPEKEESPYLIQASSKLSNRDWDASVDAVARHVDRVMPDGSEILITVRNELIPLLSNTRPFGGRYRYLFYLLRQEFLDGEAIRELVPEALIRRLVRDPPRLIVHGYGAPGEIFDAFPELHERFQRDYERTGTYALYLVYERSREPREPLDVAPVSRAE